MFISEHTNPIYHTAVIIEWEASNVSFLETLESNQTLDGILFGELFCASVINPGINNTQQSIQIQVVSEDFTAEGIYVASAYITVCIN